MPTRLWGDLHRARYGRFPDAIGDDDIARCFHLDERDQAIITELRGAHNRLGFAAQLGTVRFIGTFPSEITAVPPVVLDALARQLAETPAASLDDYWSGRQRWRHVAQIRERYGFPRPSPAENSGLCATPIPNRTFATPYVSRPFLSHARSNSDFVVCRR